MARAKKPRKKDDEPRVVNKVFAEDVPPGATPQAHHRPTHSGGPPGAAAARGTESASQAAATSRPAWWTRTRKGIPPCWRTAM
jgi:hypothetical protein